MADAMQAAGVGPEIEYKGTIYHFAPVRLKEIAKFEAWLERQAFESCIRAETWMPARAAEQLWRETRRDVASHVYRFGGQPFTDASVSEQGVKTIALICLKAGEQGRPEVDEQLIDDLFKDRLPQMRAMLISIGWLRPKDDDATGPDGTVGAGTAEHPAGSVRPDDARAD